MKATREIKKISVSQDLEETTISVEFTISEYQKLEEFKDALARFTNQLENQTELNSFSKVE